MRRERNASPNQRMLKNESRCIFLLQSEQRWPLALLFSNCTSTFRQGIPIHEHLYGQDLQRAGNMELGKTGYLPSDSVVRLGCVLECVGSEDGGVSMSDSPFKDQVPEQCRGYAQKSFGTPAARTAMDSLLLRGRLQRYELNSVINNASPLFSCLGYAVLGGLHARVPSEADFTEQFVDASGNPVVTVRVEYQKTYAVSSGINK